MKKLFIEDLKVGDSVFGELFAVKNYKKTATRNNRPYIDITLADKTGLIKGKIWSDDMKNCELVEEADIVSVSATIEEFNGLQIRVTNLSKVEKYEPDDFMATSNFDINEMWKEIGEYRAKIKNNHLKKLLDNIFDDEFTKRYKESAAAFVVHHAYRGGIQEHVLDMLAMADGVLKRYPKLNADLLITGIIVHDIGKVFDYDTGTTITMTFEGRMLGHIFMGAEYVKSHAPKNMPQDLLDEVLHMILSHHGTLEFGSPVPPKTAEAVALSYLDYASFKINPAYNTIQKSEEGIQFTEYNRHLGVEFYRSPYLDELTNEDIPF